MALAFWSSHMAAFSLRALASTPLGPWLLVSVAIGLIMFDLFSLCQARWRRL